MRAVLARTSQHVHCSGADRCEAQDCQCGVRGGYVVAYHRVGNNHRLCGEWVSVRRVGWDDGGDLLLAGTGLVGQQMRREREDATPPCLPLETLDAVGVGICRR